MRPRSWRFADALGARYPGLSKRALSTLSRTCKTLGLESRYPSPAHGEPVCQDLCDDLEAIDDATFLARRGVGPMMLAEIRQVIAYRPRQEIPNWVGEDAV